MPNPPADEELQSLYKQARESGLLDKDPELAGLLAKGVKSGLLSDLSHPAPVPAPAATQSAIQDRLTQSYAPNQRKPAPTPQLKTTPPKTYLQNLYDEAGNAVAGGNILDKGLGILASPLRAAYDTLSPNTRTAASSFTNNAAQAAMDVTPLANRLQRGAAPSPSNYAIGQPSTAFPKGAGGKMTPAQASGVTFGKAIPPALALAATLPIAGAVAAPLAAGASALAGDGLLGGLLAGGISGGAGLGAMSLTDAAMQRGANNGLTPQQQGVVPQLEGQARQDQPLASLLGSVGGNTAVFGAGLGAARELGFMKSLLTQGPNAVRKAIGTEAFAQGIGALVNRAALVGMGAHPLIQEYRKTGRVDPYQLAEAVYSATLLGGKGGLHEGAALPAKALESAFWDRAQSLTGQPPVPSPALRPAPDALLNARRVPVPIPGETPQLPSLPPAPDALKNARRVPVPIPGQASPIETPVLPPPSPPKGAPKSEPAPSDTAPPMESLHKLAGGGGITRWETSVAVRPRGAGVNEKVHILLTPEESERQSAALTSDNIHALNEWESSPESADLRRRIAHVLENGTPSKPGDIVRVQDKHSEYHTGKVKESENGKAVIVKDDGTEAVGRIMQIVHQDTVHGKSAPSSAESPQLPSLPPSRTAPDALRNARRVPVEIPGQPEATATAPATETPTLPPLVPPKRSSDALTNAKRVPVEIPQTPAPKADDVTSGWQQVSREASKIARNPKGGDVDAVINFLEKTKGVPDKTGGNLHDLVALSLTQNTGSGAGRKPFTQAIFDLVDSKKLTAEQAIKIVGNVSNRVLPDSARLPLIDALTPKETPAKNGLTPEEGGYYAVIKGGTDARRLDRYVQELGDPTEEMRAALGREPSDREVLDYLSLRKQGNDAKGDAAREGMLRDVVKYRQSKGQIIPPELSTKTPPLPLPVPPKPAPAPETAKRVPVEMGEKVAPKGEDAQKQPWQKPISLTRTDAEKAIEFVDSGFHRGMTPSEQESDPRVQSALSVKLRDKENNGQAWTRTLAEGARKRLLSVPGLSAADKAFVRIIPDSVLSPLGDIHLGIEPEELTSSKDYKSVEKEYGVSVHAPRETMYSEGHVDGRDVYVSRIGNQDTLFHELAHALGANLETKGFNAVDGRAAILQMMKAHGYAIPKAFENRYGDAPEYNSIGSFPKTPTPAKPAAVIGDAKETPAPAAKVTPAPSVQSGEGGKKGEGNASFNPIAEKSALIDEKGQTGTLREGVTRDQVTRMFKRENAAKAAQALRYRNKQTAYAAISLLAEGGAKAEPIPGGWQLKTPDGVMTPFRRKAEMDYIKTLYNVGDHARNYELPGEQTPPPSSLPDVPGLPNIGQGAKNQDYTRLPGKSQTPTPTPYDMTAQNPQSGEGGKKGTPLDDEITRLQTKTEQLRKVWDTPTQTPGQFDTGRSNRPDSLKNALQRENDRRGNAYKEWQPLQSRLDELTSRREAFLRGDVHANGQPVKKAESEPQKTAAATLSDFYRSQIKPGDNVELASRGDGMTIKVKRVNPKSITTESGSTYGYGEIRPLKADGSVHSDAEIKDAFKAWRTPPTPNATQPTEAPIQTNEQGKNGEITRDFIKDGTYSDRLTAVSQAPWMMTKLEYLDTVTSTGNKFAPADIREHQQDVKTALAEGKPVPPEVLVDYPQLTGGKKPIPAKPTAAPVLPGEGESEYIRRNQSKVYVNKKAAEGHAATLRETYRTQQPSSTSKNGEAGKGGERIDARSPSKHRGDGSGTFHTEMRVIELTSADAEKLDSFDTTSYFAGKRFAIQRRMVDTSNDGTVTRRPWDNEGLYDSPKSAYSIVAKERSMEPVSDHVKAEQSRQSKEKDDAKQAEADEEKRTAAYQQELQGKVDALKGKKGEVTLAHGQTVPATIYGDVALHKGDNNTDFTVTHINSGMAIKQHLDKAEAMRVIAAAQDHDWSFKELSEVPADRKKAMGQAVTGAQGNNPPDAWKPTQSPTPHPLDATEQAAKDRITARNKTAKRSLGSAGGASPEDKPLYYAPKSSDVDLSDNANWSKKFPEGTRGVFKSNTSRSPEQRSKTYAQGRWVPYEFRSGHWEQVKEDYAGPRPGMENQDRIDNGDTPDIARGRKALLSRLDLEKRKGDLDEDVHAVASGFIKNLPPKLLEKLGSSYVKDLGQASGVYSPLDHLITLSKSALRDGSDPDRVIPHEIAHHLEAFVSHGDLASLERQYQAAKRRFVPDKEDAGKNYRYRNFREWFAEAIADRALRDHYTENATPENRTKFQRLVDSVKSFTSSVVDYLRGTGKHDPAEKIYRRLLEGQYNENPRRLYKGEEGELPYNPKEENEPSPKAEGFSLRDRQTNSPEFKRWFGDWAKDPANASKVVGKDGKPLVVYHGTTSGGFRAFSLNEAGRRGDKGLRGKGFYFADNAGLASGYADRGKDSAGVYPSYLSVKNPYDANKDPLQTHGMWGEELRNKLIDAGYDGVIYTLPDEKNVEYVAFHPEQIKSATGNSGAFDPRNPDITQRSIPPTQLARLEAIESRLSASLSDRMKREFGGGMMMGGDPLSVGAAGAGKFARLLPDAARLMAVKMAKGAVRFSDFAKAAVKTFGDAVRPHLDNLYRRAWEHYKNDYLAQYGDPADRAIYRDYINKVSSGNGTKQENETGSAGRTRPSNVGAKPAPDQPHEPPGSETAGTVGNLSGVKAAEPPAGKPSDKVAAQPAKAAEKPKESPQPVQGKVTQGRNAQTDIDRQVMGLAEAAKVTPEHFQDWLDEAHSKGYNDPAYVAKRAREVIEKPTILTDAEQAGFTERLAVLKKQYSDADAAGAGPEKLEAIREQSSDVMDALRASGTEWGRSGAARNLAINEALDLTTVLYRAERNKGGKLTDAERDTLTAKVKEYDAYKAEADAKIAELQQRQAQVIANTSTVRRMKRTPADIAARRQYAKDELQKAILQTTGNTNALLGPIPDPAIAFKLAKYLGTYADEGISKIDDLLKRTQKDFPGAEKSDIVEALNTKDPNRQPKARIMSEINLLRKEAAEIRAADTADARKTAAGEKRTAKTKDEINARIAELQNQINTGQFIEAEPKANRVIDAEVKRLRDKEKLLKAKVQAEIENRKPQSVAKKVGSFIGNVRLSNPIARVMDVAANSLKLADYGVRGGTVGRLIDPITARILNAPKVDAGLWSGDRIARIASRTKTTMKRDAIEILHGISPDAASKYGSSGVLGNLGGKMAGMTDVPFSSFYRELAIDYGADLKARQMAGANASPADVADLRDSIIRDIDNHPEIETAAHEFALRETLNSENWVSKAQKAINNVTPDEGAKLLLNEVLFRFNKVITNVAIDAIDRTGVGVIRGGLKLYKTRQELAKGLIKEIPLDKRLEINELLSKGMVGVGMMVLGYYGDDALKKWGIGSIGEGRNKYVQWGDLGRLGGPASPFLIGAAIHRAQSLKPAERDALIYTTIASLPLNTPLASNLKTTMEALNDQEAGKVFLARKIVQNTPVVSAGRDIAGMVDRGSVFDNGNSPQRDRVPKEYNPETDRMKKTTDFRKILMAEYKYQIPGLRGTLPLAEKDSDKSDRPASGASRITPGRVVAPR